MVVFVWKLSKNSWLFCSVNDYANEMKLFTAQNVFVPKPLHQIQLTRKSKQRSSQKQRVICHTYFERHLPVFCTNCYWLGFVVSHPNSIKCHEYLWVLTKKVTLFLELNHIIILLMEKKATKFWVIALGHVSKIWFLACSDNQVQTPTESDRVLEDLSS